MSTLTLSKISGVLFVKKDINTNPKAYFAATGTYQASDDNTTIAIYISQAGQDIPDTYNIPFGNLTVGTSTPTTMSSALILLNGFFGT